MSLRWAIWSKKRIPLQKHYIRIQSRCKSPVIRQCPFWKSWWKWMTRPSFPSMRFMSRPILRMLPRRRSRQRQILSHQLQKRPICCHWMHLLKQHVPASRDVVLLWLLLRFRSWQSSQMIQPNRLMILQMFWYKTRRMPWILCREYKRSWLFRAIRCSRQRNALRMSTKVLRRRSEVLVRFPDEQKVWMIPEVRSLMSCRIFLLLLSRMQPAVRRHLHQLWKSATHWRTYLIVQQVWRRSLIS